MILTVTKNGGKFHRVQHGVWLQDIEQTCGCNMLKTFYLSYNVTQQSRKIDEERKPCIRAKESEFYFKTGKSADVFMFNTCQSLSSDQW